MESNKKIIVNELYDGYRLDAFLACIAAYSSRSKAEKYCENNNVYINGKPASKKLKVKTGDEVSYKPEDENVKLAGQEIELDVRYEDDDIIVISKQAGLVCHPAHGHTDGTLVNALINHCGKENLCNIQDDNNRLGIVHRLDADTSGLMICAKSNEAGVVLSQDMKNHTTSRHYMALVCGEVAQESGKIDVPLLRTLSKHGPKMKASTDSKAKNAITSFTVLERIDSKYGKFSLLDCRIHTGRTHQIRAHMEYINHSVFGDQLYNNGAGDFIDAAKELNLNRQFLHSYKIGFEHPITKENMSFSDDLPKDLSSILKKIKN